VDQTCKMHGLGLLTIMECNIGTSSVLDIGKGVDGRLCHWHTSALHALVHCYSLLLPLYFFFLVHMEVVLLRIQKRTTGREHTIPRFHFSSIHSSRAYLDGLPLAKWALICDKFP
jgi:hypothetical protein